jgi:hypothetical protein
MFNRPLASKRHLVVMARVTRKSSFVIRQTRQRHSMAPWSGTCSTCGIGSIALSDHPMSRKREVSARLIHGHRGPSRAKLQGSELLPLIPLDAS